MSEEGKVQEGEFVEAAKKEAARQSTIILPTPRVGYPDWVKVPPGLSPPKGKPVVPILFRAPWTDDPAGPDRQCIVWTLNDAEERTAIDRSLGDSKRIVGEYTKMMIRAFDGVLFAQDGTMEPAFAAWWRVIGQKCRDILTRVYVQMHRLSDEEREDFFANCVAVVVPA